MEAVTRLYGPGSGNQIQASHMHAYSFENLRVLLEKGTGTEALQNDLGGADWIIFAFSESDQTQTEKNIFEKFFSQRPDLARNKKIIGMAFNIPYYLDATNISKLTAYYALYSKVPEFLDVAARVLFQELIPEGDPPVSVPGIGYDLISVTSPDPNQVIPLYIASPGESNQVEGTPPTGYSKPLQYKAGDTIPIQAGVILDKNGHPVPDGTIVRFLIDSRSSNGTLEQIEVQTIDGIANVTYTLPSIGSLELRVEADPALTSQILRLDITSAGGVITSFEPTPAPEESQEVIPTPLPTPTLEPNSVIKHNKGELTILDWFLSTVLIFGVCLLFNFFSRKSISKKWNTFTTLSMALGGSLAYAYVAVSLPGASVAVQTGGTGFALIAVILGILAGLGIGFVVFWFDQKQRKVISKQ
jgi:beta-N-acetylhexosaminidase